MSTKVLNQFFTKNSALYHGDSTEVTKGIPDNSIGFSVFSPPFAELYTYSNSERDMGNSKDYDEFWVQFKFLLSEIYRITKPGRNVSIHCMDIPAMKERDGFIGIKDFSGDIKNVMEDKGFIYHSRVTVWKDPLLEVTRTKAIGLQHKQLMKDSAISRQGLPDYILTFRKPGINEEPIKNNFEANEYYGKNEPIAQGIKRSHLIWQKYASPVWMDIRQTKTLNFREGRSEDDEKHICPLQLDTIARCIDLWTNPGDIVFSPFGGVGSEPYQAVKMGRKGISCELKESYWKQAIKNIEQLENKQDQLKLF